LKTKVLIALISVIFTSLVFEILFRLFLPQVNIYLYEIKNNYLMNRPNFSDITAMIPINEEAVYVNTNSQGFRANKDYSLKKEKLGPRILILGDSISFGWPLEYEDSYPAQLEKMVPQSEVINCSVIAANTTALERMYDDFCSNFEVDYVVLQVTLSDHRGIPDYFWSDLLGPDIRIHEYIWKNKNQELDTLKSANAPYLLEIDYKSKKNKHLIKNKSKLFYLFYDHLHIFRFIQNRFLVFKDNLISPHLGEISRLLREVDSEFKLTQTFINNTNPTLTATKNLFQKTARNNAKLIVLITANRTLFDQQTPKDRPDYRAYSYLTEQIVTRELLVDSYALLKNMNAKDYYNDPDFHFNKKGNQFIAELLKDKLK
jgi:lysophospholipase L1-like esterase